jgi:hypothetical protein
VSTNEELADMVLAVIESGDAATTPTAAPAPPP